MDIPPILRQITIVVSPQLAALSVGGAVTYPTLLMERFRANNTSIQLDMDTRSWIGSIYGLAGIPAILMPIITQRIGRKWGYILTCIYMITGWILAYTATTATELFVSESFHGLGTNSLLPVSFVGMTEMLAPKYRATSMQTFGIAQGIGMAACGILGRYLHYKTISIIMLVPMVVALAILFFWPESPSWFAWKGEFEKCERAFIKLRGNDDISKKELEELIAAQREIFRHKQVKDSFTFQEFWRSISSRDFYMPSLHVFAIFLMMYWSGFDVIYIYFIEIVTKTSHSEDAAYYGGIAMYIIVLVGLIITNILLRNFKNKTVLKFSTCGVILCSFCSFVVTSLQALEILPANSLLLMCCLIGYMSFASCGLNGIVFIIAAELMPVKHRSLGGVLYIVTNCLLYASSMKISPYISFYIGLWCTFLIYTVNAILGLWFVYKYLPETRGRTMQEIEDFYAYGHFVSRRDDDDRIERNLLVAPK